MTRVARADTLSCRTATDSIRAHTLSESTGVAECRRDARRESKRIEREEGIEIDSPGQHRDAALSIATTASNLAGRVSWEFVSGWFASEASAPRVHDARGIQRVIQDAWQGNEARRRTFCVVRNGVLGDVQIALELVF